MGRRGRTFRICLNPLRIAERPPAAPLPKRYAEVSALAASEPVTLKSAREELENSKLVSRDIADALALIGDYANALPASAVHYPTIAGQSDPEADHYKWFVFNDGAREYGKGKSPANQFLKPLAKRKALPELEELA